MLAVALRLVADDCGIAAAADQNHNSAEEVTGCSCLNCPCQEVHHSPVDHRSLAEVRTLAQGLRRHLDHTQPGPGREAGSSVDC